MESEKRDINDIFDDIVMTEETLSKKGYEEGFKNGVEEGNLEGYKLGYAKGVDLGNELGSYYGTVLAYIKITDSGKIIKALNNLKISIEKFPKTNDPDVDIIEEITDIRTQYKKVKALLKIQKEAEPKKDLTF